MNPNTFLKQLLFTTVRIVADTKNPNKKSVGTGFLVERIVNDTQKQIFLVTNKHVIAESDDSGKIIGKYSNGTFSFIKKVNGLPSLGNSVPIQTQKLTDTFFLHPDDNVDLAIFNISNLYNQLNEKLKQEIFIKAVPLELIPSPGEDFDAVEDILFVGYPNGIWDQANHLPITRKGITASSLNINFNGMKKFLIDAQVYPGSSGSPVFIKEQNLRNGQLKLGSEKYFFVGVISKVFQRNETGDLIESVAPTTPTGSSFSVKQMIGLGICEKAQQIIELIELHERSVLDTKTAH